METLKLILSGMTTLITVISMQMKKMSHVLISQIVINVLAGAVYLLNGAIIGGVISLVAILQAIATYVMDMKGIKARIPVTVVAMIVYSITAAITFKGAWDLFPYFASLCFALSVSQKKADIYRLFGLGNTVLWLFYDVHELFGDRPMSSEVFGEIIRDGSIFKGNLPVHVLVLVSICVAVIRYNLIPFIRARRGSTEAPSETASEENVN